MDLLKRPGHDRFPEKPVLSQSPLFSPAPSIFRTHGIHRPPCPFRRENAVGSITSQHTENAGSREDFSLAAGVFPVPAPKRPLPWHFSPLLCYNLHVTGQKPPGAHPGKALPAPTGLRAAGNLPAAAKYSPGPDTDHHKEEPL